MLLTAEQKRTVVAVLKKEIDNLGVAASYSKILRDEIKNLQEIIRVLSE